MEKTFPDGVVEKAWKRSGERCECTIITHPKHYERRCPHNLIKPHRKDRKSDFGWDAFQKNSEEGFNVDNCIILCWDCHQIIFRQENRQRHN